MDKKTLIKVAVVGVILLFVLEPIAINVIHRGKLNFGNAISPYKETNAILVMELSSYDNYIVVNGDYSNLINDMKKIDGVKSVTEFENKIIIETNDTYNSYKKLKKLGISGKADATFMIDLAIADNKELNVSNSIGMNIEPLIKPGTKMKANADVIYKTQTFELVEARGITPIMQPKKIKLKFKVINVTNAGYVYDIDWSDRNKARELGYNVSDIVLVNTENIQKAYFVRAIGDGYILVNENITNKSIVENYYNVTEFKDTYIKSNKELNLSFAKSVDKIYNVTLENEEYGITKTIESTTLYEKGEEVDLEIEAMFSDQEFLYPI